MRHQFSLAIHIATVAAWVVAGIDISPWGFDLAPDRFLFTIAAACVSSYAWIAGAHARPAVETYLAGKDIGRREALLEQQCENVKRMSEQPSLRVLSGGR